MSSIIVYINEVLATRQAEILGGIRCTLNRQFEILRPTLIPITLLRATVKG